VIEKGEPAILVCHWPGIYFNGEEVGFNILKEVVRRLDARYDNLLWMKQREIARYWAARELTRIRKESNRIEVRAPFAAPRFTIRVNVVAAQPPTVTAGGAVAKLDQVSKPLSLKSGTWCQDTSGMIICFDLAKGQSTIQL
jgi:hypothetical protein